jgi:transposase
MLNPLMGYTLEMHLASYVAASENLEQACQQAHQDGASLRQMAEVLGVHHSTVARWIERAR